MTGSRISVALAILFSVATAGLLLRLVAGVNLDPGGLTVSQATAAEAHAEGRQQHEEGAPARQPLRLESLPCFGCHNFKRFIEGGDAGESAGASAGKKKDGDSEAFPHGRHRDEDGLKHCHLCHAFKGHLTVVTRKALCEECH